jgi:hypothetical protein
MNKEKQKKEEENLPKEKQIEKEYADFDEAEYYEDERADVGGVNIDVEDDQKDSNAGISGTQGM